MRGSDGFSYWDLAGCGWVSTGSRGGLNYFSFIRSLLFTTLEYNLRPRKPRWVVEWSCVGHRIKLPIYMGLGGRAVFSDH